jgi:hypothetical protein
MLLTGSPVKPANAISRAKPAPASGAIGRKRKAIISLSDSPEPRPRAKRGAMGAKNGQSVFGTARPKVEEQTGKFHTHKPMSECYQSIHEKTAKVMHFANPIETI